MNNNLELELAALHASGVSSVPLDPHVHPGVVRAGVRHGAAGHEGPGQLLAHTLTLNTLRLTERRH